MATITIRVTVTERPEGLRVSAIGNPQAAKQSDIVTWVFDPGRNNLDVVFKEVQFPNRDKSGALDTSLPLNEQGPLDGPLSRSENGNEIRGTIAPDVPVGRYLYDIRAGNNRRLRWDPPVTTSQNFGGLDVPKSPPGG
jgi:hypothetical protein